MAKNRDNQSPTNTWTATGQVVQTYTPKYDSQTNAYLFAFYTQYFFVNNGNANRRVARPFIMVQTDDDLPREGDVLKVQGHLNIYNQKATIIENKRKFVKRAENPIELNSDRNKSNETPDDDDFDDIGPDEIPF